MHADRYPERYQSQTVRSLPCDRSPDMIHKIHGDQTTRSPCALGKAARDGSILSNRTLIQHPRTRSRYPIATTVHGISLK